MGGDEKGGGERKQGERGGEGRGEEREDGRRGEGIGEVNEV